MKIEISASDLIAGIREGQTRAIGRAITEFLDPSSEVGAELRKWLDEQPTGAAHRIGITGPPGVGKSTLVAALARELRARDERVGVVASDPASPFSGGAFLGDRVRLAGFRLAEDPGVFFRSLAHRESGGIGQESHGVSRILEAAGFPWIFLETVGTGQSELAVRDLVDTVVVVVSPEQGDEVQLMKAGILEIADIYVVNRADHAGAEKFGRLLAERAHASPHREREAAVVLTEAVRGTGVEDVIRELVSRREASGT